MESSAPKILEDLIARAEKAAASDVHLQMMGSTADVFFRLDGVMTMATTLPEGIAERVFGRIKFLARLKTYQESMPQDGRISKTDIQSQNDIRVATYPTVTGEKIVLRLFATERAKTLEDLEFSNDITAELKKTLRQTSGLLLLTGPAGSGKTTTIYACLRHLLQGGGRHIITVEDPVEQVLPGIMQTEINEARGLTFGTASRHLLRQDPEVMVIGEIRDSDTVTLAVRAALTGHLVISTLHAGSCKGVFERLMAMCPDHYAVTAAVQMVLNQRLLRKVCPKCGGAGCMDCLKTGFQGRVAVAEFVRVNEELRTALKRDGADAVKVEASLESEAAKLLAKGVTNKVEMDRLFGR